MGNKNSGRLRDGVSQARQGRGGAGPGDGAALADDGSGSRAAAPHQPETPDVTSANLALVFAGFTCAVPLTAVREVLPGIPAAALLPDSPAWLLGVFQWRGDLIALIDPLPVLTGNAAAHGGPWRHVGRPEHGGHEVWHPVVGLSDSGAAIVLGDSTRCIALAVDAVGPLVSSTADPAPGRGEETPALPRYTAGITATPGGASYPVLRSGALLEDVVAALTEEGGSADA